MFPPDTPESIALTMRHDFGLLQGEEREAVLREARQIWTHHVEPLLRQPAVPVRRGYSMVRGTPAQLEAQVRALDVPSGWVEVIVEDAPTETLDGIAKAFDALAAQGIRAIVHAGDVELRQLAPAAVPRLVDRVQQALKALEPAFEECVTFDHLGEQTSEGRSVLETQDLLRLLRQEILVAGLGDFTLDIEHADPGIHDEAVREATRLASAFDGVGMPLVLRYDRERQERRWTAAVVGAMRHDAATPGEAVSGLLEAAILAAGRLLPEADVFRVVSMMDPECLFAAQRATGPDTRRGAGKEDHDG